jgi:hypothetical protein
LALASDSSSGLATKANELDKSMSLTH